MILKFPNFKFFLIKKFKSKHFSLIFSFFSLPLMYVMHSSLTFIFLTSFSARFFLSLFERFSSFFLQVFLLPALFPALFIYVISWVAFNYHFFSLSSRLRTSCGKFPYSCVNRVFRPGQPRLGG